MDQSSHHVPKTVHYTEEAINCPKITSSFKSADPKGTPEQDFEKHNTLLCS